MVDQKTENTRSLRLDSSVLGQAMNCLDRLKLRLPDQKDKLHETYLYLSEIHALIRGEGHMGYAIKSEVKEAKKEAIKETIKEVIKEKVITEKIPEPIHTEQILKEVVIEPSEELKTLAIKEAIKKEVILEISPEETKELERLAKIEKLKTEILELEKEDVV